MQKEKKPIVGVSTSFTGKYQASKLIIRFLELLKVDIIKSTVTKPAMIEAGTTLASAEFCLPLRVYVGHIYILLNEHPEINYLLAPIIKGEHPSSSTCAKYRDLDGVIIRSLGSMTGYYLKTNNDNAIESLNKIIGETTTQKLIGNGNLPNIIAPEIESLNKEHLRQVCFKVYSELFYLNPVKKLKTIINNDLTNSGDEELRKIESAFNQAYFEVIEHKTTKYERLLSSPEKIRLAILGRSYLVNDSALTADIKTFFTKKGVAVITLEDIPYEYLEEKYNKVNGFYDYHKLGQSFIDTLIDKIDGFVVIGSFGCHPDAFQMEYFANYITERGKSCWTFKFDEQTGSTGFHTRFETIIGFLEQKRDERLKGTVSSKVVENNSPMVRISEQKAKTPIFIWPYMGSGINLMLEEIWYQLGLGKYMYQPVPVNEDTIDKGGVGYIETCSPFALYLGSLRDTMDRLLLKFTEEAKKQGKAVEARRIIILMAGGKGPCTFGWYSIAGEKLLQEEYAEKLKKHGHTLEMISIDNQGRNLVAFLREVADVAENNKLRRVMEGLKVLESNKATKFRKTKVEIEQIKLLKEIVWSGWKKLLAYEEIQNKALIVRAHELDRGKTTKVLNSWIKHLEKVHTAKGINNTIEKAFLELEEIKQDQEIKPRVVVVGEIYVSLAPFANRGTVDNLLGYLGIEAVEGMRLSHFIMGAFKGVKYSYFHNQPFLKPAIQLLEAKGLYSTNQWVREPIAKPFIQHEVGGDGQPTVARARHHIEEDGVDGILHIYPFKCMPEGIAKDALIEMSQLYSIKSLHLSFSKETEIERLKTELGTFATLLQQDLAKRRSVDNWLEKEIKRRKEIGKIVDALYVQAKHRKEKNFQLDFTKLPKSLLEQIKKLD